MQTEPPYMFVFAFQSTSKEVRLKVQHIQKEDHW